MSGSIDDTAPLAGDAPRRTERVGPVTPAVAEDGGELPAGTRIDHFVVSRVLGSGGMGIVYLARDADLDREVALKLVRTGLVSEEGRARLLREAQAMARLSHPSVVTVYEVGTFDDQLFIAMELVAGETLADWLRGARRGWREVLDLFLQAGRGLAAAHAAGIVHRDFKPANVIVEARAGRARVVDFGLARPAGAAGADETSDRASSDSFRSSDLTRTGALLGTPAYMPPEQRQGGERATERSDQYSFCVSLHEGLFGARPEDEGPAPRRRDVPAAIVRLLRRGLRRDPAHRHESMAALLAELERAARPRGGWLVAAAAVLLLGGGLVAAAAGARGGACDPGPRLAGVWDEARRALLGSAFRATRAPYAGATLAATDQLLGQYARDWRERYRRTCATPPSPEREVGLRCLEQRRANLGAVVSVLSAADAELVGRALDVAGGLDDLALCAAGGAAEPTPVAAEARAAVAALRTRLAARGAANLMGRFDDGELASLLGRARALGYRPLEVEVLSEQAAARDQQSKYPEAVALLEQALPLAKEERYDRLEARLWHQLAAAYHKTYRDREAHQAAELSRAVLAPLGGEVELERMALDRVEGRVYADEGRLDDALQHVQGALARAERLWPATSPRLVDYLSGVGYVLQKARRPDDAEPYFRRAIAILEQSGGEDHPALARLVNNLGSAAFNRDDDAAALGYYQRALAIKERILEPGNVSLGYAHLNVGQTLKEMGRYAEALPHLEQARDLLLARLGPDVTILAAAHEGIGRCLVALGRPEEAIAPFARALAMRQAEGANVNRAFRGGAAFGLAVALAATGRDEARVAELARSAREDFVAAPDGASSVAELDRWQVSRRR